MDYEIDFSNLQDLINSKFYPYLEDYRRYQIYKGGAGSGKSVFCAQKIIYNIINLSGFNVLSINKVAANNHDTTFAEIKKWIHEWGLTPLFKINESRGGEEITYIPSGDKIIFRGLDDPEKLKSITFDTGDLVCIWIEEASAIVENEFNQLDFRLRGLGDTPKFLMLSFNPIDIDSWIKKRFFDYRLDIKDGFVIETTYKDNKYLDEKYKQILENYKTISQYHYDVYVLNKWGNVSGTKVFYNIEIHDFDIEPGRFKNLRHGLDFGFDHPQVFVSSGEIERDLYIYYELYERGLYNSQFIDKMELEMVPKDFIIAADSARPDSILELQNRGYINTYGVHKVTDGEALAVRYLQRFKKIHIHKTRCPNSARSFSLFKKLQIRDKIYENKFVDIDDDPIDAVRYSRADLVLDINIKEDRSSFAAGF